MSRGSSKLNKDQTTLIHLANNEASKINVCGWEQDINNIKLPPTLFFPFPLHSTSTAWNYEKHMCCLGFFVNSTQTLGRENFDWENVSIRLACRQIYEAFFFYINDWCASTQAIVGGTSAGQVILGGINKQDVQGMGGKPWGASQWAVSALGTASASLDLQE